MYKRQIQNGLLVLQESRMVGDSYDVDYDSYGTCSVIDLATGKNLSLIHILQGAASGTQSAS